MKLAAQISVILVSICMVTGITIAGVFEDTIGPIEWHRYVQDGAGAKHLRKAVETYGTLQLHRSIINFIHKDANAVSDEQKLKVLMEVKRDLASAGLIGTPAFEAIQRVYSSIYTLTTSKDRPGSTNGPPVRVDPKKDLPSEPEQSVGIEKISWDFSQYSTVPCPDNMKGCLVLHYGITQ